MCYLSSALNSLLKHGFIRPGQDGQRGERSNLGAAPDAQAEREAGSRLTGGVSRAEIVPC